MADKGVIIEFDFAVIDGAQLLYEKTREYLLRLDGIPFDASIEARFINGVELLTAFTEYFPLVKTKKTPAKAAREVQEQLINALMEATPAAVTPQFANFVTTLVDHGLKVVISTRAPIDEVSPAFGELLSDNVVLRQETTTTYGSVGRSTWRRICAENRLFPASTLAVTGSGNGVKSAMMAGLPAVAVRSNHVAYQDFSGADEMFETLDAAAAKRVLLVLRIS